MVILYPGAKLLSSDGDILSGRLGVAGPGAEGDRKLYKSDKLIVIFRTILLGSMDLPM